MTAVLAPRVVVVTRPTDLALLVDEHGTRDQARFATRDRPEWFEDVLRRDELQRRAVAAVLRALPLSWRRATITRDDLATFDFAPEDIIVPVGQDGLVANVAKYVAAQPVLGINPDPANVEGRLVQFGPADAAHALAAVAMRQAAFELRTLVQARLDDGQRVRALNEVFVGHRSHQSARYRLRYGDCEERQSSSGLIVATGTGATGWARSIARERDIAIDVAPAARGLMLLVREAFPAPGFGTSLTSALVGDGAVTVFSEMGEGGVIFGDGIEADFLRFAWGRRIEISAAPEPLRLVVNA